MKQTRVAAVALSIVSLVTAVTVMPTAAMAAGNNNVGGTVPADATWGIGTVTRHKTDRGNMLLTLNNNVDGGVCVQIERNDGDIIGPANGTCWAAGEYGQKTLATNVAPMTFSINARKRASGGINNDWGGVAYY